MLDGARALGKVVKGEGGWVCGCQSLEEQEVFSAVKGATQAVCL